MLAEPQRDGQGEAFAALLFSVFFSSSPSFLFCRSPSRCRCRQRWRRRPRGGRAWPSVALPVGRGRRREQSSSSSSGGGGRSSSDRRRRRSVASSPSSHAGRGDQRFDGGQQDPVVLLPEPLDLRGRGEGRGRRGRGGGCCCSRSLPAGDRGKERRVADGRGRQSRRRIFEVRLRAQTPFPVL